MSQTLQAIERTIETLSFNEKLWLLERIVQLLRTPQPVNQETRWADVLANMAEDPDIQSEITVINNEFMLTEADGLNNP